MTNFWIAIAALTVLALGLIWLPFLRRNKLDDKKNDTEIRKQANLGLYNERLEDLNTELTDGRINQDEFTALEQELQVNLLQNVEQEEDKLVQRNNSVVWPVSMSVVLLAISGYIYNDLGRANDWNFQSAGSQAPHQGQTMTPDQMMAMQIEQIEAELANDPNNSQGWFNLGHAYISASRYSQAVKAFDKAIELVGAHADLLGPKATAMYYQADENITPEVRAVIDQALADDDKDPSVRLLLGMDAFFSANYEEAIMNWEIILTSPQQGIDREGIMNAIAQAQMFIDSANKKEQAKASVDSSKAVTVTVELAADLVGKAKPTDTVFVYANATGGNMPVAIARIEVKELPSTVVLDDSFAMTADSTISSFEQVNIIAAINLNNSKAPTAGDMQGEQAQVKLGQAVTVTIDTVIQ
ncbi:c-type cytochrome biogenesis protein CcmI [Ferrimonas lipolytica]|uniref:C-type cytochrome biogenesis protein CcmI n=1 Tax=Ferrimonas lipolytica TaxID=2724191 RepID=A0A6H1UIQ2_9GAMM|nr:c-type cytochrome biogenesis protein CcmI [Ferrimonas lipolytica]QIZ78490.1 c-type cytochrome biogenesis protein CcmI [Ferrimonas lipolytica]